MTNLIWFILSCKRYQFKADKEEYAVFKRASITYTVCCLDVCSPNVQSAVARFAVRPLAVGRSLDLFIGLLLVVLLFPKIEEP